MPPYTVSVRSLCEFTVKRGDLDRRFTPTATALEGIRGQQTVAMRRGPDYETELPLETQVGALRVSGRADGYDPHRKCLEEVKAIRGAPEDIPENRRLLHWAQLQTYGALFCRVRQVPEVRLALVYFDVASQTEAELLQVYGADELEALLLERCEAFAAWAARESEHRLARDGALSRLSFPKDEFRPGQRTLAAAVYRTAESGGCLLAQAPTGIGKTVGTLFPLLRAMPGQGIDKVAFLTCKGTARLAALDTLDALRSGLEGGTLRVQALTAKEQACEHPDKACHGDDCPLARGFYDRLPEARDEAVRHGWLDARSQRRIALRHGVCPYYLGQELTRWADVLVGDVNHVFDATAPVWGLMQALDWKLAVLVDEAHNLVERARRMYSGELNRDAVQSATSLAPASVRPALVRLAAAMESLAAQAQDDYWVPEWELGDVEPDDERRAFTQALQSAGSALSEHFLHQPLAVGPLLNFHFELQHFMRLVETLDLHSLFEVRRPSSGSDLTDVRLSIRNVSPAPFLRPRVACLHSLTLFSATLAPPRYAMELLGLPEASVWLDVPPAFEAEHLVVRVADRISTRYRDRSRSLAPLVDLMAEQFGQHPGNYLAFFSSFEYLRSAAQALAQRHPGIPQWSQASGMDSDARDAFLARFTAEGEGIGFAVLGGLFAEGVDLPGRRLIGAFIATLAWPPVSAEQAEFKKRLQRILPDGHGYADLVPAMQKVVQAAGRVLRTPDDRGWLWLMDDRYRRADVVALLPPAWGLGVGDEAP